jgi:DNA replication protein DnaC
MLSSTLLDDWGLAPFNAEQRRDMLELLDDRYGQRSTIVTSQMPVDSWHELIGDLTLADAILDRLVTTLTGSISRANQCASGRRN